MKVILDRFEGDYAIVELGNKTTANMPRELVPAGAEEGDVLSIKIDLEYTNKRKEKIESLMDDLFE